MDIKRRPTNLRSKSAVSRRSFLKTAGMLGVGAGLSRMPQLPSRLETLNLRMWWWADDPGFSAWIDDTVKAYAQANPNVKITTLQQDTCCVISQFTTAAAAKESPDIQFFFNGLYHMENVWQGYLAPLDDLIPADVLKQSNPTALSIYDGKQYRTGWYPVPLVWEYNKDTWSKAKLDADNPPKTWDAWMAACDKLKTAGFIPMGGGLSDGFWGEWYLANALTQALDTPGEAIELFIGDKDFRDPKYHEFWDRLADMVKNGYLNKDMLSVDLFTALDRVLTGELATTQNVGAVIPKHVQKIGDRVGIFTMPVYGKGKLAGRPINDAQGFGIPSDTKNKKEAADFLVFMQSKERLDAMWKILHYFPTNTTWDSKQIDHPVLKQLYDTWVGGSNVIEYIPDLMPTLFWSDAMFVAAQDIVAGKMTGEQAGEQNAKIVKQWRDLNPDLIEKYRIYAKGLNQPSSK